MIELQLGFYMFPHVIFFFIEKEILERLEGKYNCVKDKIRYPPSVCGHVHVSVKDKISSKCVCVRLRACVCAGVCVNDKIRYPPSVCVCVQLARLLNLFPYQKWKLP